MWSFSVCCVAAVLQGTLQALHLQDVPPLELQQVLQ